MVLKWLKRVLTPRTRLKPLIIPRAEHTLSRSEISEPALKVLYRLHKARYQAYLVGGCVRDLLLGVPPKDFDVVTNATPDQIKRLFRNCRLIGRRFRLAHVCFGDEMIEVATFRAPHDVVDTQKAHQSEHGVLLRDNVYSKDIRDDVLRRDFTVNALYYNIADFSIVDYVGGFQDVYSKTLRLLGDPYTRYREDPVRMLRAIRFASQRDLSLAPETEAPFAELAPLITHASHARLFEELPKLFLKGAARKTFKALHQSPLFPYLFPGVHRVLQASPDNMVWIDAVLESTDARVLQGKPVTIAFVLAGFLWPVLQSQSDQFGWEEAAIVFAEQDATIQITKRMQQICYDIWALQSRLEHPNERYASRLLGEQRFRAAFDFLAVRVRAGENLAKPLKWWEDYQLTHSPIDDEEGESPSVIDDRPVFRRRPRRYRNRKPRE